MIVCLPRVLDAEDVSGVLAGLRPGDLADGRGTAGATGQRIKNNLELRADEPRARLFKVIRAALSRSAGFRSAAFAMRISAPIFSLYEPGMAYGEHVDNPLMGEGPELLRSDIAMTIFLSDPESYDGGELAIDADGVSRSFKPPAGDAVLYPATTIHQVTPLTRGRRWAAVLWIQSMVRDAAKRQTLWDMSQVLEHLWTTRESLPGGAQAAAHTRLQKTYFNLLRRWAEV